MPFYRSISRKRSDLSPPPLILSAATSLSMQRGVFRPRKSRTQLDNALKFWKERMIAVRSVKSATTVRPAGNEANHAEFTQFVLNGAKSEAAHIHQFAYVALLLWRGEEQLEHLGAHFRKQHVQNRAF